MFARNILFGHKPQLPVLIVFNLVFLFLQICRFGSIAMAEARRKLSLHPAPSGGHATAHPARGRPSRKPLGVHLRPHALQAVDALQEHAPVCPTW